MIGEAPIFGQLPDGPNPLFYRFLVVLCCVFLTVWGTLPAAFDAPPEPIHVLPLALAGQSCEAWDRIVNARNRLPKLWGSMLRAPNVIIDECRHLSPADDDPLKNPTRYVSAGQAMALLDATKSECGSDEARRGGERYFLILCSPNPETYNVFSWTHELWHLTLGHTALRHAFSAQFSGLLRRLVLISDKR